MTVQAERIRREVEAKQQVSEFVTKLFEVSDPNEVQGNSITPREFLDRGATIIRGALTADPRVRSELMATMGKVYRNLGLYPQAEPLLEQSLETQRRLLGRDDPETLRVPARLGTLYCLRVAQGSRSALNARRSTSGSACSDPSTRTRSSRCRNLGLCTCCQERFKEAEALFRETLDIRKRVLGPEHPDTLSSMSGLANSYLSPGPLQGSRSALPRDARHSKTCARPGAPDTLMSMRELAMRIRPRAVTRKPKRSIRRDARHPEARARPRAPEHAHVDERPRHGVRQLRAVTRKPKRSPRDPRRSRSACSVPSTRTRSGRWTSSPGV